MSLDRLSDRAQHTLYAARTYAADLNHYAVTPAHLAIALLSDERGASARLLARLGTSADQLSASLSRELAKAGRGGGSGAPELDDKAKAILEDAARQAKRERDTLVRTHHLLIAIADGPPGLARRALHDAGVTRTGVEYMLRDMHDELRTLERAPRAAAAAPGAASNGAEPAAPIKSADDPLAHYETLSRFGRDLTQAAIDGRLDPVIGRDDEIRRLIQILGRRSKNNPVLVGEPGVGKTSVIYGFAQRIAQKDVPTILANKRVVELDMGALVAGTSLRGQFEERVRKLIDEVSASEGQIILYIDDLHLIVGNSGESGSTAGLLKPALARGQISLIGTTSPSGFRNQLEKDKGLERLFQGVPVDEPSEALTMAILRGIKQKYEIHHRVTILDEALSAAVSLGRRYVMERLLPDKAVDLMDEAASRLRMQIDSSPTEIDSLKRRLLSLQGEKEVLRREPKGTNAAIMAELSAEIASLSGELEGLESRLNEEKSTLESISNLQAEIEATENLVEKAQQANELGRAAELKYGVLRELSTQLESARERLDELQADGQLIREEVTEEDVALVVGEWTGVPATKMLEGERQKLLAIEDRLCARVIGQEHAVSSIAAAVRRSRAGVQERNRPIGNFFFVGPTGVGKTELAKALAEFLFDSEDALIRIDMSEYMEQSKVNSLIGSAFGYVDSDRGGILTEAVRRRPYAVVLFDEAEKAHPDIFNVLLQVLDEGRLSDSQGRKIDFTNTIIIMTSNVGARRILDLSGQVSHQHLQDEVDSILKDHFKPEFLNRLDEAIVFRALDRDSIAQIFEIILRRVSNLLAEQGLSIELSDKARQIIIDAGYQPEFGARPLRRALLTLVQDPLALMILEAKFEPGDTIYVDADDDNELTFEKK